MLYISLTDAEKCVIQGFLMRITIKLLTLSLLSVTSFGCASAVSNASQIITASGNDGHGGGSAEVRIIRPPVSSSPPDMDAPLPSRAETKIVVKVPVYLTNRRAKNTLWWPYRASDRAFGPNYPGFRKVYFGPLYPF
jgi:hypothetical protein